MLHTLVLGLLIGWGVALPFGPINLEMIRRNLSYGFWCGLIIGIGAICADLTYIILITTGALVVIQHPLVLKIVGIVGAIILFWFGWQAIKTVRTDTPRSTPQASLGKCYLIGYSMALFSPFTILFWASLASQVIMIAKDSASALYFMTAGIVLGILSWLIALNLGLHLTRHRLSPKIIRSLNVIGGLILWAFALYGLIYALR